MVLKIKLAIEEPTIVITYQELIKETWKWWIHKFPRNFCYFHLEQHLNIQNLYTDKTKQLFDTTILQQLEQFVGKNNLTTQAKAIYQLHAGFQDRLKILLNPEMDSITVNQIKKINNTQFEELQNKITQVILEKEVQEILKDRELKLGDLENFNRAQY
ncbi:hypothetical protein G9A89_013846 [Geosiphon pyriformis]|nr:hypothetical protein G9A89_013846 [Geosiphon pyriformis]